MPPGSTIAQRKVCTLGDFAVGKTSLIRRYVAGVFDEKYLSTIGVAVTRKTVELESRAMNLILWDLAGGNDYLKHQPNYLRGAAGALIVCDLTRPDTLAYLERYASQLRIISPKAEIIFIGNKADLENERQISDADIASIAEKFGGDWQITSAKTGANTELAFTAIAARISNPL